MLFSKNIRVTIENDNVTLIAKSGINLYKFLRENNCINQSLCEGKGQCGRCKIFVRDVSGKAIKKPSKKEKFMIADINLQAGCRLACQYILRSDIIIKIEQNYENPGNNSEILGFKIKSKPETESILDKGELSGSQEKKDDDLHIEEEPILSGNKEDENSSIDNIFSTKSSAQDDEIQSIHNISSAKIAISKDNEKHNPEDGVILVQYPGGIKYYIYSAGIANIAFEDVIKIEDSITDIIDSNAISDFIYDHIKQISDINRIIMILDKRYYSGTPYLGLINYYSFNIGTMLCEVIQPENNPYDLLLFFRLLYNNGKQNLFLFMDNLDRIFYSSDQKLFELHYPYTDIDLRIDKLLLPKKNPIISISDDFAEVTAQDKYVVPDSITFPALLSLVNNLINKGMVSNDFILKDRNELINNIPIEKLIKFSYKSEDKIFYIYRKNSTEIYIDQYMLDLLYTFKQYNAFLLDTVKALFHKIDELHLFTTSKNNNIIREMLKLELFPEKYAKKITYFTGDPAPLVGVFMQYSMIPDYMNKRMKEIEKIDLSKCKGYDDFLNSLRKRS